MNICVLSGSPKGKNSITFQTVLFLQKKFPNDTFETIHVGARIKALEKDMTPALEAMKKADLLLFCYPVYTFIVPYQLHRFVELMKESGMDFSGKYAAQISTSKHFYDVTAHRFIEENCLDMGLKYLAGLSADMEDLLKEQGQKDAVAFWNLCRFRAENDIHTPFPQERTQELAPYVPSGVKKEKLPGREAVIVANLREDDDELAAMIQDFRDQYPHESSIVNLNEYPFRGGCLGCFHCAVSGKCVYTDGFDEFLRTKIQGGSAIIYAFRIQDHSMGSRMKLYDDRQFCNGHRTVTSGMPMGYIIRGDLSREANLQMIIRGRGDVGGNFLAGIATDRKGISDLARELDYALEQKLTQPATYLGIGGMKIFRDLIYTMQGMMKADHKYYKAHGIYDFPQKQVGTILKMKLVGALLSNPKVMEKAGSKMTEGMLMPYTKLFARLDKQESKAASDTSGRRS